MSIAGVLRNRIIWFIRLISSCFRRITDFVRFGRAGAPTRIGTKNFRKIGVPISGELPSFVRPEDRIQLLKEGEFRYINHSGLSNLNLQPHYIKGVSQNELPE